ncbi:cytochrome P450 [Triangularia setosa]|uniref:Cytochrome P450 n=1 Tax=Triangularia setosa TaxID=2587417 RepID=A0AAN6VZT3_9PEZI|nr:cytochrome P450 [Podospora setosa]
MALGRATRPSSSAFYDGGSFAGRGIGAIVSERGVDAHGQMRRYLSHIFSDLSLSEQEDIIARTMDVWVESLLEKGPREEGFEMGKSFEMMKFDIIGKLAFGETFGGIETGALADAMKRFPTLARLAKPLLRRKIWELTEDTRKNEDFAIDLINRRIRRGESSRKYFMTRILQKRDPAQVSDLQLTAHTSDFSLAGSETTGTALSAIMYYLLRTPKAMSKLQSEIRGSFETYSEIDSRSTLGLSYLEGVILEGLRIYPPLPLALPRVGPNGGDTVDGHVLPSGFSGSPVVIVSTHPIAASLSPTNFKDPQAFKPERWLSKNQTDMQEASQPFSLGTRGCMGRKYLLEMLTTLAKVLWKYDLELVNTLLDWQRDSEMHTLWREPALWVRVRERTA